LREAFSTVTFADGFLFANAVVDFLSELKHRTHKELFAANESVQLHTKGKKHNSLWKEELVALNNQDKNAGKKKKLIRFSESPL
jgi:hypothetical protein